MAPKPSAAAAASSSSGSGSSYSSSSGDDEEEEVAAPKKTNGSSSAPPNAPKPSSTSTAPQVPKPKSSSTSTAAAQGPKPSHSKLSSSEEEGDDDEEEKSSDEDEEDSASDSGDNRSKPPPPQQQSHPPLKPTTAQTSDSGSADDSDSSDSSSAKRRRSSRVADPSIKPLASKPMDEPSKTRKPASTPAVASVPDSKDSDRKKPKAPEASSEHESGGQKRQLFQRIWSEEDELAILRGMVDYRVKKGTVPSSTDMDTFHDFIQKSLQVEVSKTQLVDKVRRLKKKYDTAATRGKNGAGPAFTKPHERTSYELSKKIWGAKRILSEDGDANGDVEDDSTRKRRKIKEEHMISPKALTSFAMMTDEDDVLVNVPLLRRSVLRMGSEHPTGFVAKRALELVDDSKAMTLEEKHKKLRLSEMKQHLRQMDIIKESVKLIMDAIEKSG